MLRPDVGSRPAGVHLTECANQLRLRAPRSFAARPRTSTRRSPSNIVANRSIVVMSPSITTIFDRVSGAQVCESTTIPPGKGRDVVASALRPTSSAERPFCETSEMSAEVLLRICSSAFCGCRQNFFRITSSVRTEFAPAQPSCPPRGDTSRPV